MITPKLINKKGVQYIEIGKKRYKVENKRKSDQAILRDIIKIIKMIDKSKRRQRKKYVRAKKTGKSVNAENPKVTGSSSDDFIKLLMLKTGTKVEDPFKNTIEKIDKKLEKYDKLLEAPKTLGLLEAPKPQGLIGAPPQILIDRALAEEQLQKLEAEYKAKEAEYKTKEEELEDLTNIISKGTLMVQQLKDRITEVEKNQKNKL